MHRVARDGTGSSADGSTCRRDNTTGSAVQLLLLLLLLLGVGHGIGLGVREAEEVADVGEGGDE